MTVPLAFVAKSFVISLVVKRQAIGLAVDQAMCCPAAIGIVFTGAPELFVLSVSAASEKIEKAFTFVY